ncbi:MAG: DUF3291 domain-containing protein [Pseudomonadota bacterium]
MHLAQLNIAVPKYDLDDPRIADFMNNIYRINSAAERMEGFVWRFADDSGGATETVGPWGPGPIINMSVWETPEHLENFVWNTLHKRIYQRKHEWFDAMRSHHFVMWWVDDGYRPTLNEAKDRLDYLNVHGNSDHAFDWAHLPHVKLWQSQRCG